LCILNPLCDVNLTVGDVIVTVDDNVNNDDERNGNAAMPIIMLNILLCGFSGGLFDDNC